MQCNSLIWTENDPCLTLTLSVDMVNPMVMVTYQRVGETIVIKSRRFKIDPGLPSAILTPCASMRKQRSNGHVRKKRKTPHPC